MFAKLKDLFNEAEQAAPEQDNKLQVSLAALLVEMSRADFDECEAESNEIVRLLAEHFSLSEPEALALLETAQVATNDSVCLHDFTRSLHSSMEPAEKIKVIELLWKVALSDNKLDKYEDYLVRKVADLMHVSPSDVVRLKHEVKTGS